MQASTISATVLLGRIVEWPLPGAAVVVGLGVAWTLVLGASVVKDWDWEGAEEVAEVRREESVEDICVVKLVGCWAIVVRSVTVT